ncbi:NAD(P)H-hydrate dehydratase [Coxiella endosymbiont of Amblyomma nuttalli]|uniref:NAD(P)H-hydrate dehydratase n=1 Tax=Coxiella endosymbiont of Amblyomma nuttalli TaxID=2749996 RepID=UPI001BAB95EC|nr:NAD(P)H-hydrate dehydratase [Coxiella endosymbiont of Amblyomma nuttalli]QTS83941.1 Bifunctional NAD(P)H-hydrate repair enzyme Nnr [Coxiella endosymbiont of Amblyomma nuttalli]
MIPLYQNRQICALERLAIKAGIDDHELMLRAGRAAFDVLIAHWPEVKAITVCCGNGNNGGDGFVIAQLAHEYGLKVTVYLVGESAQLCGAAAKAAKSCQIPIQSFSGTFHFEGDLIVDALLGSGLSGNVRTPYAEIIETINKAPQPKLAVDVPSGINVDTGEVQGCAVKADVTVTFIGFKRGLYTNRAPAYCGKLLLNNLNFSNSFFSQVRPRTHLLEWRHLHSLLPKRERDSHKGTYGHALIVGGDYGMGGAVRMAAEAAARVGAGLVTVATRPEHVPIVSGSRPELMCHQVAEAKDLEPLINRAIVVVVGPGLGRSDWAKSLLNKVLETKLPKVLDADSLVLLSEHPLQRDDWILTPHPGEASRLLEVTCQDVQRDRFRAIAALQKKYRGIVVLKGAGTLIKGDSETIHVCPVGNPGMASGGMGDILSGVIGGLLAQRLTLLKATELGVFLHSLAADYAAKEGGERGLLASDLLPHLRLLVNP